MESISKEYSNGEITVVWKPTQCIHSTLCWKGLVGVFNPKKRPWIDTSASDTDTIRAQVEKCPSGALSYFNNSTTEAIPDIAVETTVEVTPNGPLLVYGNITVKNKKGEEEKKYKVTALCRCGASANKPYCDGSHVKTGFKDE
jgi:uncharacterized Fe-S cluster protein YjdI